MALRSGSFDEETLVLATLKQWALTANDFTYQWQHHREPTIPELLPPLLDLEPEIEARLAADHTELPHGFCVRSDLELGCVAPR